MRLVHDHCFAAREDLAEALVLEREVAEQQMVVDYGDLRLLRRAPRLGDEAGAEVSMAARTSMGRGRGP